MVISGPILTIVPQLTTMGFHMSLPLARTNAEAHLYMDLAPCPDCGARECAPVERGIIEAEGDLASWYVGTCPQCGRTREFKFRLPEDVIIPDPKNPVFGDERPSELLDAGQWLWLADLITRSSPAEPTADMTAEQRRKVRTDLLTAASAISEAVKFVAPGMETVPGTALWTGQGREVYEREPGRFHRRRLEVVQRTYREIAERFA
jgi:hypothetical protein